MLFKATTIAALAFTGAFAAPTQDRVNQDIVVRLTGNGVPTWEAVGFSPKAALSAVSPTNPGPFSKAQVFFSDKIKKQYPGIENNYRCALLDEAGNRIVVTRGANTDFNFGDNGNPNAWTLKNGPVKNVKVTCDPSFAKISPNDVNTVLITLSDSASEFGRSVTFHASQVSQAVTKRISGAFRTVKLTLGPGVDNQKLRCQLKDRNGNIILADRGTNLNKKTFGDANKGEWKLDVAGNGIATVATVTCDPSFA
jgi:hypothetical protein